MAEQDDNPESFDDLDELESAWDLGFGEVFAADDDVSSKDDQAGEWCGRFRLLGEIARGGMGIVYRARDERLERDVAIKIIRKDRLQEGDTIARFLEEAQIAGQLQHPGVVPVYETGLDNQDRPFFCMKLVEGETFAHILRKREDPCENLGHFINIFSSLCQMVSFAHARGVIHRDLKPSNIMIGAFGEVQVLDWGFAKIMGSAKAQSSNAADAPPSHTVRSVRSSQSSGSSASLSGSVLGTPSYMAPEQARGEIDEIDERCDVFALGAILCEILTGKGPHGADSKTVTASIAAIGDMQSAFERLQCLAGPDEMKQLATWCLQPQKGLRPRNAFVVADAVASHIDVLEASRHDAQVEVKAAEHRLIQEQKARRLTVVLGALIVFVVIAGATLWWDRLDERRQKMADLRAEFQTLMATASERSRDGSWSVMDEALARAKKIADHDDTPRRLKMDFDFQSDRLLRVKNRKLEAEVANKKNSRLAKSLDDIRLLPVDDSEEARKRYAEAFLVFGVDIHKNSADSAYFALDRIPQDLRNKVVAAFDDWAARERDAQGGRARPARRDTPLWRSLISAAQLLDRDTWRRKLRFFALDKDRGALLTIARDKGIETRNAQSILLLANSLAHEAEMRESERILWLGFVSHPDDFWINYHLSRKAIDLAPGPERRRRSITTGELRRAERHAWLSVSLQPASLVARRNLVNILLRLGETKDAVSVIFESSTTTKSDVENMLSHIYLGLPIATEYQFLREIAAMRPEDPDIWPRLSLSALAAGDFDTAESAARKGIEKGIRHDGLKRSLAQALLDQGRLEEAQKFINENAKARSFQRMSNHVKRLIALSTSQRPIDLPTPGGSANRARILTWAKKSMAAARAWDDAIRQRPNREPGSRPGRPEGGNHRSIERDAVAALVFLALDQETKQEQRSELWDLALKIANRSITGIQPTPGGHIPLPLQREWKLWFVDPRLAPARDGVSPDFTSAAQSKAWHQFWEALRAGAR
ncbi:MAG: serine/threonine protein kinase [Planctomycetota bacterium]|jgi:serine/threonine protein kinase